MYILHALQPYIFYKMYILHTTIESPALTNLFITKISKVKKEKRVLQLFINYYNSSFIKNIQQPKWQLYMYIFF